MAPTTTAPPTTAAPTATTPSNSTVFQSRGGSIGARCRGGDQVELLWANPASGYAAEIANPGPVEVEVRFRSDSNESRVKVVCNAGQPVGTIEEETHS